MSSFCNYNFSCFEYTNLENEQLVHLNISQSEKGTSSSICFHFFGIPCQGCRIVPYTPIHFRKLSTTDGTRLAGSKYWLPPKFWRLDQKGQIYNPNQCLYIRVYINSWCMNWLPGCLFQVQSMMHQMESFIFQVVIRLSIWAKKIAAANKPSWNWSPFFGGEK